MILSKERLNKLLDIFSAPKSINPYNNSMEKQELNNCKDFIKNYHIYGSPYNYINNAKSLISKKSKDNLNNSEITHSRISFNNSFNKTKSIKSKILSNPQDLEIKQSLTNLRLGQSNYKKQQQMNEISKYLNYSSNFGYKINTNNYSQNPNLISQNMNIVDSYKKSSLLSQYMNYIGTDVNETKFLPNYKYSSQIGKIKSLNDIPANPDDVIIKELPPNFVQMSNRISSQNINVAQSNINNLNADNNQITENTIQPISENPIQPITEEINTGQEQNEEIQDMNKEVEETKEIPVQEEENKIEEEIVEETPPAKSGKYQVTAFNGPIKLPQGYSTDDEAEFNAIQMINDDISTWKLQIDKPNYKIYSKPFKTVNEKGEEGESRMFYLDATIDSPASEVNKQLNSFELRKEWEESLKKGKLIKEEDLGNGMKIIDYYGYIKMPFIFADRDMVVRKTIWENYNGEKDSCLNELHSIEHPDFPPKEKPVRATLENKSKYVKPIDGNKTKFYYVNKFDLKVSVGGSMMETKGAEGTEKWFKGFLKQLGK